MSAGEPQTERHFIDTNIWLYTFIVGQDLDKSARAKAIIQARDPVISVQVINQV